MMPPRFCKTGGVTSRSTIGKLYGQSCVIVILKIPEFGTMTLVAEVFRVTSAIRSPATSRRMSGVRLNRPSKVPFAIFTRTGVFGVEV